MEDIIGSDFEFDAESAADHFDNDKTNTAEVEDAPVVKFLHKMLMDAFSMRASDLHFEPFEHTTAFDFESTVNCVKLPLHRLPSRTSWPPASRLSQAWTFQKSGFHKMAA
jgi:hypothetical protein